MSDTDDAKKGLAESGETKVASEDDLSVITKALNEDVKLKEVPTGADSLDEFASPHNPVCHSHSELTMTRPA